MFAQKTLALQYSWELTQLASTDIKTGALDKSCRQNQKILHQQIISGQPSWPNFSTSSSVTFQILSPLPWK